MIRFLIHWLRLVAYGTIGILFSACVTSVYAEAPAVTYSAAYYGGSTACSVPPQNGFSAPLLAADAIHALIISTRNAATAQSYTLREPLPTYEGAFPLVQTDVRFAYDDNPGFTCSIQIVRVETCPTAGNQPYVFAPGDIRCRPAFCSTNVGKYTTLSVPTGTTGIGIGLTPTPPANICLAGCVANNVGGMSFGLELDSSQSWTFIGDWRFTGTACTDFPGLATYTGFGPSTLTASGSGSSGGGSTASADPNASQNATNLGTIATGTTAQIAALNAIKDKFNASFGPGFGDCDTAPTCTGDTLQCTNAINQRIVACAVSSQPGVGTITTTEAEASLADLKSKSPGTWWGSVTRTVDLTEAFNRPRWLAPTGCPVVPDFQVLSHNFSVSLTPLCEYANLVAAFLIISASLVAYRIIATG